MKLLKVLLSIILPIVILYLLFYRVDTSKMISDLKGINYYVIVASFVLGYMAYVSRGVRWAILLRSIKYKVNTSNAVNCVSIGYLTNLILPRAGEVARCTAILKVEKVPLNKLIGTVLVERVIDVLILFILILGSIILSFDKIMVFFEKILDIEFIEQGAIVRYIYILLFMGLVSVVVFYAMRKSLIYKRVKEFFIGVIQGLESIKHLDNKASFIFHTLFIWLCYFLMTYVVFFVSDWSSVLSLSDALFILVVGGISITIPIPGGIGVYHSFVMIAMTILGLTKEQGLIFATLLHTTQSLVAIFFWFDRYIFHIVII